MGISTQDRSVMIARMVKVACTIIMRIFLLAYGRMINQRALVSLLVGIKRVSKGYFREEFARVLAYTSRKMVISMRATGAKINDQGMANRYTLINHKLMKDSSLTTFVMVRASTYLNLAMFLKESGVMIEKMEKV
jgi:hypothetical protein